MTFSWPRILKVVGIVVLACGVAAGIYLGVTSRPVKILLASWISDDHEHYLPCEQLPFYFEVTKSLEVHEDIVEKIKQAGAFDVRAHQILCPTFDGKAAFVKGDILIEYDTHAQRVAIEKLIGDYFFGIPYEGENH